MKNKGHAVRPVLMMIYSNKDLTQAGRLMQWIGFLGERASMKDETLLIVASQSAATRALHQDIVDLAATIFGTVHVHVPQRSHEVGWPGAPNWMFRQGLFYVEQFLHAPAFLLEPDAIPLEPEWWSEIIAAWQEAQWEQKHFMGALVPRAGQVVAHMTGVAMYGEKWRSFAPSLVTAPDDQAWDVWSASEVLPHAMTVNLIQHIFYNPQIHSLDLLQPAAVIFHQDKTGQLFPMLDAERFNGEFSRSKWSIPMPEETPTRYYHADNALRDFKMDGIRLRFAVYSNNTVGSARGVLETNDPKEQAALEKLMVLPTVTIREITKEEAESLLKKKLTMQESVNSNPSPAVAIKPGGLVVADGTTLPKKAAPIEEGKTVENIDEVLQLGTVRTSEPAPVVKSPARRAAGRK